MTSERNLTDISRRIIQYWPSKLTALDRRCQEENEVNITTERMQKLFGVMKRRLKEAGVSSGFIKSN